MSATSRTDETSDATQVARAAPLPAPGDHAGWEELLRGPILADDIAAALAELPAQFRTVLLLYDVDGFGYDEIWGALAVRRGTVSSRLHRAHAQLRDALAHRAPTGTRGLSPCRSTVWPLRSHARRAAA